MAEPNDAGQKAAEVIGGAAALMGALLRNR
jgi:hypothetical protein